VTLRAEQPAHTDSSGYIQKWAAGKPSDESLRKDETQSPTVGMITTGEHNSRRKGWVGEDKVVS